jgi:hypothetical protein
MARNERVEGGMMTTRKTHTITLNEYQLALIRDLMDRLLWTEAQGLDMMQTAVVEDAALVHVKNIRDTIAAVLDQSDD